MSNSAKVDRLMNRWKRYASMERKLSEDKSIGLEAKMRSYGAWLAYRMCSKELKRMFEEGR